MEFSDIDIKRYQGYSYTSKAVYRDPNLSLKAKGLMSLFSSLPDSWKFSEIGLAAINADGIASIKSTIKELKEKNYLEIERERKENGQMGESRFKLYSAPSGKTVQKFTQQPTENSQTNIQIEDVPVAIMTNYHLRDRELSLKAKGLLSLMFSLPPNWVFSEKNLTQLSSDGLGSVRTTVLELKEKKYLKTSQERNEKGFLNRAIYCFYRMPYDMDRNIVSPEVENPTTDNPITDNLSLENPLMEEPLLAKNAQIKTISTKTNTNKDCSLINHPHQEKRKSQLNWNALLDDNTAMIEDEELRKETRKKIQDRIKYDFIISQNEALLDRLEEEDIEIEELNAKMCNILILEKIIDALVDVYLTSKTIIRVGKDREVSKYRIIEKFERMRLNDIKDIISRVEEARPKNTTGYILTVLSNY